MPIGRIYRVIHLQSDLCYVGSTFNELRFRWQCHKNNFKCWNNGKCKMGASIYPHMREHGINQFKIILIKEYNVCDRAHLHALEQLWINKLNCVNTQAAFAIDWMRKVDKQKYNKQRYEANRESINEKHRQYNEANKEAIREKQLEKHNCDCGGRYTNCHKSTHIKTKRHQAWLSSCM